MKPHPLARTIALAIFGTTAFLGGAPSASAHTMYNTYTAYDAPGLTNGSAAGTDG